MRGSWSGLMGSWTKAQIEGLIPWGGFLYFGKSGKCRNFSTLHLSIKMDGQTTSYTKRFFHGGRTDSLV